MTSLSLFFFCSYTNLLSFYFESSEKEVFGRTEKDKIEPLKPTIFFRLIFSDDDKIKFTFIMRKFKKIYLCKVKSPD